MKKRYIAVLILIFSTHFNSWSQNERKENTFFTVAAKSGLTVRSKPSINSEKIGKFPPGEHLELIEDTGIFLSVMDNGLPVNGNWFKVKRMNHSWDKKPSLTGYVFSGYLLKNKNRPYNPSNAIATNNSTISFDNFNLKFYFYETYNNSKDHNIVKNDTIYTFEDVFNNLSDKLVHIQPKIKVKKVELFYTFTERIWEYSKNEQNSKKPYSWKGNASFKKLDLIRDMALFSKIEYKKIGIDRQLNLKLRDTLVHYPGEMGGTTATISYKGRPCIHFIPSVLI